MLEHAPPHIKLPIALMMYTGIDPVDALKYPKSGIADGRIQLKRAKTGGRVSWPIPPQLLQIIDEAPKHDCLTLCATSRGLPWTGSGFRASWRTYKNELAKKDGVQLGDGLTLKGLRHTVATILAEMGFDSRTIADVLGQKTTAMADEYTKEARLDKKWKECLVTTRRNEKKAIIKCLTEQIKHRNLSDNLYISVG